MRRNGLVSLLFIVAVTLAAISMTLATGNSPLLGLDLQGGVSVVLEPEGTFQSDALGQAQEIIRSRVDALGVAEPEISRQDDAIIVQLPGVKDRERALELVGQTAELRFRPVLEVVPNFDLLPDDVTSTTAPVTTETSTPTSDTTEDEQGLGLLEGETAAPAQTDEPTTTTSTPTTEPTTTTTTTTAGQPPGLGDFDPTPPEEDDPAAVVILETLDGERLRLGPSALTGEALSTADARLSQLDGAWSVSVEFRGGSDGIDQFNVIAADCFNAAPSCPTGRLAIVLDSIVQSAPTIQQPSFARDQIQITGDFDEGEAKDLALVLRYGALPVELVAQQSQTVSATLGKDALDAGVTAGLVGLAVVALYMLVYYRLLGVVAMLSLGVSAALLWSIVAYLGESQGLALTLAGVTGIIVSIGVAVDSNVVFYEHLKEDVSRGRTLRTAVEGSFTSAFRTIVKADVASLIGAGLLWWLTVGPVRGFAFYLGLSTMLDLVASYFFMRPLTVMLARSGRLQDRPRVFGLPTPTEATTEATTA